VNLIKSAMTEKLYITFQYYDRLGKKSIRKIEPYRLALKNSNWYIQGYCCDRLDFRIFSISSMESLKLSDEHFVPREFDYASKNLEFRTGLQPTMIKLLVDESLRGKLLQICDEKNISNINNGKFIAQFPIVEDDYWFSLILQFGSKCECLEPPHVREALINRIESMLQIYH